jgi:hypothetical protein
MMSSRSAASMALPLAPPPCPPAAGAAAIASPEVEREGSVELGFRRFGRGRWRRWWREERDWMVGRRLLDKLATTSMCFVSFCFCFCFGIKASPLFETCVVA